METGFSVDRSFQKYDGERGLQSWRALALLIKSEAAESTSTVVESSLLRFKHARLLRCVYNTDTRAARNSYPTLTVFTISHVSPLLYLYHTILLDIKLCSPALWWKNRENVGDRGGIQLQVACNKYRTALPLPPPSPRALKREFAWRERDTTGTRPGGSKGCGSERYELARHPHFCWGKPGTGGFANAPMVGLFRKGSNTSSKLEDKMRVLSDLW